MGLLIMMGIFAFGVVIGVPVAFALGIGAVSAFYFEGLPLIIAFQRIISGINVFSLLAIPFFIFAGELMFHGCLLYTSPSPRDGTSSRMPSSA